MRTSTLTSGVIALGFMAISSAASASCSNGYCTSSSSYGSYNTGSSYSGSTSYSSYGSSSRTAPCPAGSSRSSDGLCMSNSSGSVGTSYSSSSYSSASAPLGSYTHTTGYTSTGSTYSSSTSNAQIVPFTTTVSNISNYRVPGMGANEYLSPTECPVSVYNPNGGKVLGCYSVVKPKPVVRTQVRYNTVRVVRPVIYVRYPVPVAVPVIRPTCGVVTSYSRYGNYWPRAGWGQKWGRRCGG